MPFRLKKIQIISGCHSFPVIHGYFQLKFGIYMCHKNAQVKFRYAFILIIFSNVVHLALMYHSVRHFLTSPRHIDTFLVLEQVSQVSLKMEIME